MSACFQNIAGTIKPVGIRDISANEEAGTLVFVDGAGRRCDGRRVWKRVAVDRAEARHGVIKPGLQQSDRRENRQALDRLPPDVDFGTIGMHLSMFAVVEAPTMKGLSTTSC